MTLPRTGTAGIVEKMERKSGALDAMLECFDPGRSGAIRSSNRQEIKATTLIGKRIEQASAKIRAKGAADEKAGLAPPIYAARFPVPQVIGDVEPRPHMPGRRRLSARARRLHAGAQGSKKR